MAAVQHGSGREAAHEIIKEHAVATAHELRDGVRADNNLPERLASDGRLPLALEDIRKVLDDPGRFVGSAPQQVDVFVGEVRKWQARFPDALTVQPAPVL